MVLIPLQSLIIPYDPKTVIDLSSVNFAIQEFNFSDFNIEQLKSWILKDINQTFDFYKISLVYKTDYGVKPLDDTTLKQFLASKTRFNLNITIFAQDKSLKCINGITLQLINNPKAPPAPPDPPVPPTPPTPHQTQTLTIIVVVLVQHELSLQYLVQLLSLQELLI